MYKLYSKSELNDFAIACIGRRPLTNSGFIRSLNIKTFIPDALDLDGFVNHIKYVKLDLDNGTGLDSALKKLNQIRNCNLNNTSSSIYSINKHVVMINSSKNGTYNKCYKDCTSDTMFVQTPKHLFMIHFAGQSVHMIVEFF